MLNALFTAAMLMMQAAPVTTSTAPSAAAPGSSGTVSPVIVQSHKKARADDERVICRKEVVLGTLFPKEVCARKQEFDQRTREDQAELRNDTALRPYDISKGLPQ